MQVLLHFLRLLEEVPLGLRSWGGLSLLLELVDESLRLANPSFLHIFICVDLALDLVEPVAHSLRGACCSLHLPLLLDERPQHARHQRAHALVLNPPVAAREASELLPGAALSDELLHVAHVLALQRGLRLHVYLHFDFRPIRGVPLLVGGHLDV